MEWFAINPGLGDGELEFVDVGVVDNLSEKRSSSFGGEDAVMALSGEIVQNLQIALDILNEFYKLFNCLFFRKS